MGLGRPLYDYFELTDRLAWGSTPLIMSSSSKKLSVTINDAGSRVVTSEKARRPTADEIIEAEKKFI